MTNDEHQDVHVMEDEKSILLDHEADGIKELDNRLPRWWVWLFYISIIFSAVYMVYFHVVDAGSLQIAKYEKEMGIVETAKAEAKAEVAAAAPEAAAVPTEPSSDEEVLAKGQQLFMTHCVACHSPQGQGLVGPNLTDNYWIHGGAFSDTVHTITEGVPAKGMITWKTLLGAGDIHALASYIFTLRGTNPPNPKAPEGEEYTP
ncbi:MAG: c-type cytochrome [Verrucomicrobia bacterium]|nr:c-type cytochrome [Verrucomicrobiota bacterium]